MRISHKWHFRFERKAKKALDELSDENRRRVFRSLEELLKAEDPQAVYGVKKLVDVNPPVYRQRQGNYRIILW